MKIEGEGARIAISVKSYENTEAQLLSDANWLACAVDLEVGPVTAAFVASFATYDFSRLREQLANGLASFKGSAVFETDEEALGLRIDFEHRGSATVSGVARMVDRTRVAVEFRFETDQTFLRRTLTDLDVLCGVFPIKDRLT